MTPTRRSTALLTLALLFTLAFSAGCARPSDSVDAASGASQRAIQNKGSDTMVNLALAWAEAYRAQQPDVAIAVTGGRVTGAEIGRLLAIARHMISADIRLIDEVEDTLAALSADFPLLLITKGDLLHQQDKVARSGLGRYFSGVEVVSDKTPATYADILRRRGVEPARFLMVGNSLRSDILPVAEIGGHAVYVPIEVAWVYDVVELPTGLPGTVHQVARLGEVVPLVSRLARPNS